jgi:phospholipid/cholesterol/gamma-HCH transport system substrate-binding protein
MRLPEVKSFRDRNQAVVGIVGLLLIAGLIITSLAVGTLGLLEHRYELSAVFERAGGIGKGADVRVAGVAVGSVTAVTPDFDLGQVVVTFEVDDGIDLGPATTAEIAAATLLGGYYLRLDGPVEAPHLEDLPSNDTRRRIPLERTVGPTTLNTALADTTNAVNAIDVGAANRVLGQLAGAADRNTEALPVLVERFTTVATALAARGAELRRLADSAATVTGALAARDDELARLIDTAGGLLDALASRRDELATVLGSGSAAVEQLTALMADHRAAIDNLLSDLDAVAGAMGESLPAINRGLGYAGTSFELLLGTLDPAGGFNIRGEGIVVHPDQLANIADTVADLVELLGLVP